MSILEDIEMYENIASLEKRVEKLEADNEALKKAVYDLAKENNEPIYGSFLEDD